MEINVEMNHYFQEIKKGIKNHEVHFDEFIISNASWTHNVH